MKARVFNFLNISSFGSKLIAGLIIISVINFALQTEYPELQILRRLDVLIAIDLCLNILREYGRRIMVLTIV